MNQVTAGTTAYLQVAFRDKDGTAALPTTVNYEVKCLSTGNTVVASTSVTPATSVTITLTPTANTLQSSSNVYETRRVIITAGYGAGDSLVDFYDYQINSTV